jgi:cytochrome c5
LNAKAYAIMHTSAIGSTKHLLVLGITAFGLSITAQGVSAQGDGRSGKEVVDAVCASCHVPGTKGAPKIGDKKAWAGRAGLGLTNLTQHALEGIRQMPSHGGNPNLTDLEIGRAITYMVNQSGGHWAEPTNKSAKAAERSGEEIVKARCVECHRTGKNGAPRIGDRTAWIKRVREGLDAVVLSAIKGHGGMPARGGMPDLTDSEVRSAILFMFNQTEASAKKL